MIQCTRADGVLYDLHELRPEDVEIEDLAHRLSHIGRFGGALPGAPYTVAQHCVLVSILCTENPLGGLLHDLSEALIGDVISPIKHRVMEFVRLEQKVEQQLRDLGYPIPQHDPAVHRADKEAYEIEKYRYRELQLQPLAWHQAKKLFLARYRALT
jgi:5'-deoxynucleotidase YfbR-like HD superfamily hydrolase